MRCPAQNRNPLLSKELHQLAPHPTPSMRESEPKQSNSQSDCDDIHVCPSVCVLVVHVSPHPSMMMAMMAMMSAHSMLISLVCCCDRPIVPRAPYPVNPTSAMSVPVHPECRG